MEFNPGTFIGLGLMAFGIILAIAKYQYENDEKKENNGRD